MWCSPKCIHWLHRSMTINSTNDQFQMQSSTVYRVEVCADPSGIIKIKSIPGSSHASKGRWRP